MLRPPVLRLGLLYPASHQLCLTKWRTRSERVTQLTVDQDEQCDEGDEEPVVRRLVGVLPLLPREQLSSVVAAVVETNHAPPAGAGRVRVQVVVIVVVIVIIVVVIIVVH